MEQTLLEMNRKERGAEIAKTSIITKTSDGWTVPSQSGNGKYDVKLEGFDPVCSCPDYVKRKVRCKHIFAVEMTLKKEVDSSGNMKVTQTMKVTYAQDWHNYDYCQTNEKLLFLKLLDDLCYGIEEPEYKFGRPKISKQEMIFLSALKVYSTFSLRRFMSDASIAQEKGYITKKPCYASIGHFMQDEELTPLLYKLIEVSALPLSAIETKFAIDSTGFSNCRFARYFSFRHQKDIRYQTWLKVHAVVGVKTNVITNVKITQKDASDIKEFKELIESTAKNFKIEEVSADKAYSSRENYEIVNELGGTAFIPFKKNATGKAKGSLLWKKMYHYFEFNKEEFLQHYHLRSNVESSFHMVKSKFRDSLRSKTVNAQTNEVLLKILCHNICCVMQEMKEINMKITNKE